MHKQKHIVVTILKHTATLDFIAPLLWKLRKINPEIKVSVLYCSLNRWNLMRSSLFYKNLFKKIGVHEYDYLDFTFPIIRMFAPLLRLLFRTNTWDKKQNNIINKIISKLNIKYEFFLYSILSIRYIMKKLSPSLILFDNRTLKNNFGIDEIIAYSKNNQIKIVLLPLGPHHTRLDSFVAFEDRKGQLYLPENSESWMPFINDKFWKKIPKYKDKFFYTGYPGFDTEWIDYLKSYNEIPKSKKKIRCLFIVRTFMGGGSGRSGKMTDFMMTEKEIISSIKMIRNVMKPFEKKIDVVLKPHPSNNYKTLKPLLIKLGCDKWKITYESMYSEIGKANMVIGLFSTSLLPYIISNIPVVIINNRIQNVVYQINDFKELYSNFRYNVSNDKELNKAVNKIFYRLEHKSEKSNNQDVLHLRKFYPDNSLNNCLKHIEIC